MNVRKTSRQGFTLIELLVVIAIMAVLASLLFAVFSRVRESGRSASCQSNLRQIALSIQQYSADHNGRYPVACSTVLNSDGRSINVQRSHGWAKHIQPYIKNTDVFQCPNENHDLFHPLGTDTDYAYNMWLSGIHDAQLAHPSTTVLNVDWDTDTSCNSADGAGIEEGNAPIFHGDKRHSKGGNYSFVDGHVKWIKGYVEVGVFPSNLPFTFSPK